MPDPQSAIEHFRRLSDLAASLSERGIALYEHEYFMLVFGSFRIELGTRHKRWGLAWDGKDGYLEIFGPYEPPEGRPAPSVPGKSVHIGLNDLDAPFSFIRSYDFAV